MRFLVTMLTGLIILVVGLVPTTAQSQSVPVEVWADTDEIASVSMSPDGRRIAMLQRVERGGNHRIVVFDTDDIAGSMQVVNFDEESRSTFVFWQGNDRLVLNAIIELERAGDPITYQRFLALDPNDPSEFVDLLETGSSGRNDIDAAAATLQGGFLTDTLPADREHVIMGLFVDASGIPDYYKVNIRDGSRERVLRGNDRYNGFGFDWDGEARSAVTYDPDGPRVVSVVRVKGQTDWVEIGALDATNRRRFSFLGFFNAEEPNEALVVSDMPGQDTQGLFRVDVRNPGNRELIVQQEGIEPSGIITSPWLPDNGRSIGMQYANQTRHFNYLFDDGWAEIYGSLEATFPDSNFSIIRMSDDRSRILVFTSGPQDPGTYYLMSDGRIAPILRASTEVSASDLAPTTEVIVTARDGRPVPVLATIPAGDGPRPGIVVPHGGPWVRDTYGYDEWAAMLANQGYVVIQPNYRGSTQTGREHWISGDNEWGQAMQDDIEDAILHFADEGIIDRERMAIFGWSYGGYAAMTAAARDNGLFNCSVAGAGVADIGRIRGGLTGSRLQRRYQQPTVTGFNPIEHVGSVTIPMLVVHGDADTTVPVDHSRRWVAALERAGVDHEYIEIENMRHSPFYYEQNMQWFPAMFEFFDTKCGF